MASIFSAIFSSVLHYKDQKTNDVVEAYPERLHVRALPERRYLKTSRVMAIIAFLSITVNFGLGFVYMKMASSVSAVIATPLSDNASLAERAARETALYRLDTFNQRVVPIETSEKVASALQLLAEGLIEDFLTLRYNITGSYDELLARFAQDNSLALYSSTPVYEGMKWELEQRLADARKGITQQIYIYSIKNVFGNFFEVVFDVFRFSPQVNGFAVCKCLTKDEACVSCLRKNAQSVQRYRAFLRVNFRNNKRSDEAMLKNPHTFQVNSYTALPLQINNDIWTDVDRAL